MQAAYFCIACLKKKFINNLPDQVTKVQEAGKTKMSLVLHGLKRSIFP
jgi:hypothetical protein